MEIFKYTNHGLKILRTRSIRASAAAELNDPFELTPTADPEQLTAFKLRNLLSHEAVIVSRFLEETKGRVPFALYKRAYLQSLPRLVLAIRSGRGFATENLRKHFATLFDCSHRMFCASKRKDSILMWSHYANNHAGMVIGFFRDKSPFNGDVLRDVRYSESKVHLDLGKTALGRATNLAEIASTKFTAWSYEEEVRALFRRDDSGGATFITVPPQTISEVVFGARCPDRVKEEALEILKVPPFRHVKIFAAQMSRTRFALEFESITSHPRSRR